MQTKPAIHRVSANDFLAALLDPTCQVLRCRAIVGRVPGNWHTEERIDPCYEVHYLFCAPRCAMQVSAGGLPAEVPQQTLLWFPPGVPYELGLHSLRSSEPLVRLRFQPSREGRILSPFAAPLQVPAGAFVGDLIHRLFAELIDAQECAPYRARCLLGLLSSDTMRALGGATRMTGLGSAQLHHLREFVAPRIDQRPSPADLARLLGYSPAYFARLFQAATGTTPRRWLVDFRIRHAADRLLDTDQPIQIVALEYGYDDPFLFARQFTGVMGCCPRAWRDRHGR